MNIYVGNLSFDTTEADIQAAFVAFGEVKEVRLISDRYSGRSKGFAFVEMPKSSEAEAAIQDLNGKPFQGRPITVNEARPRDTGGPSDRGARSSGGSRSW